MRGLEVMRVTQGVHFARTFLASWVLLDDDERIVLIDCGYPGQMRFVEASIQVAGLRHLPVEAVLLTHAHADHAGNAAKWRERGARVLGSVEVVEAIARPKLSQVGLKEFRRFLWRPRCIYWAAAAIAAKGLSWSPVDDAEVASAEALAALPHAPVAVNSVGHAAGHSAYLLEAQRILVSGDALAIAHPISPTPATPGPIPAVFSRDAAQALLDAQHLVSIAGVTVLPGHGPAFKIPPRDDI